MNARDVLNKWFACKGYRIERTMPVVLREEARLDIDLDFLIQHEIFRRGGHFHFVQIGANDGVSRSDDLIRYIRQYPSTGIMVEPQPDLFNLLQHNLADYPAIDLVNMAVHKDEKEMTLYRLDPELLKGIPKLPLWAQTNGIASFDRDHVLEHAQRIGLGEEVIESQQVHCISMDALLARSGQSPDVLKVDTEGYDYEVLAMFDLDKWRPSIIRFEHLHMSTVEYEMLIKRLIAAGYRFLADKMNTTAYLLQPSD
jgi:FkbM family methyltransferase